MEGEGKDNRSSPHGDIEEEYNESVSKPICSVGEPKGSLASTQHSSSTAASEFQFISGPCVAADAAMSALSPCSGDEEGKSTEDERIIHDDIINSDCTGEVMSVGPEDLLPNSSYGSSPTVIRKSHPRVK